MRLYAHASRVLHLESNPGNARALIQAHGEGASMRDVWLNPPPIPLATKEMDWVYELPYRRRPHPSYGGAKIPAASNSPATNDEATIPPARRPGNSTLSCRPPS